MVAGSTQSRKQKGRQHQQQICADIRNDITDGTLTVNDVWSTSMGASGMDIKLSERARNIFPFAVECKRVEKIAVPAAFIQAKDNAKKEGLIPLLIYRRNRESAVAVVEWAVFKALLKRLYTLEFGIPAPTSNGLSYLTDEYTGNGAIYDEYIRVLSEVGGVVDTYYQKGEKVS